MTFAGRIGRTVGESVPYWPVPADRKATSPNVVVMVLDDVGFGQLGCYGSSISTPNMDSLAADGLRYSNFHVTALCSPTRASLLTGRNHHSVGVGFLADFDTGYPGYRGAVKKEAGTLAEMLGGAGYGCYAVGKWHLTPPAAMTPAGPFDQWPTGRGFDRYYGFLWGEDDQWAPELWYDQHHVEPPGGDEYHLSEDLVNRAQEFLADHIGATPERPFYLHLAFGACHAPHQAPPQYLTKYRGAFDHGWDVERGRVLVRQIDSGLVPEGTELPESNPDVRPWASLSADERRLYARFQEAFAGFMEHTDDQVGRLLGFMRDHGLADNTIVVLMSDNGASGEGGQHGSVNEYRYFWGLTDSLAENLGMIDDIGGRDTHNHYPSGWAQAGNTPLKLYKKYSHGGGVRAPLIIRWPQGTARPGDLRRQFHHVTDIVPTILDVTGVAAPTEIAGVPQMPIHGTSMAYTFAAAGAEAESAHRIQYFETAGHRAIYRDGYKLVASHAPGDPYENDRWQLYDLRVDFAENRDLASERPELARELEALWWAEAEHYGVLPLDDRMQTRIEAVDPRAARSSYRLLPGVRLPNGSGGPNFRGRPFDISATIAPFRPGDHGVLVAYGRRAAGFVLYVEDDQLTFDLNLAGRHTVVTAAVPQGATQFGVRLSESAKLCRCAVIIDDREAQSREMPSLLPAGLGCLSLQIGHNSPSTVSGAYRAPYRYSGDLRHVDITLGSRDKASASQDVDFALATE